MQSAATLPLNDAATFLAVMKVCRASRCLRVSLDGAAVAVAPEAAQLGRQHPVGNFLGDVAEHVIARGLGKRCIGGGTFGNLGAQPVDRHSLAAGDPPKGTPGRILNQQGSVAVAEEYAAGFSASGRGSRGRSAARRSKG